MLSDLVRSATIERKKSFLAKNSTNKKSTTLGGPDFDIQIFDLTHAGGLPFNLGSIYDTREDFIVSPYSL